MGKRSTIHSNVSLSEIGGGAVEELFQNALAKIFENIDDVNTSETAPRKIVLTFVFSPKSARDATNIDAKVECKLAGNKPVQSFMSIRKDGESFLGFEPVQEEIPLPADHRIS